MPNEDHYADHKTELEVSYDELLADNHKYMWQVVTDYDKLQKGGLYIHSNAEPLGDFDPAYKPFVEALANNDIEYKALRCSGHDDEKELKEIIDGVQPAVLVPVHTLHTELEENTYGEQILPKRGQTITL